MIYKVLGFSYVFDIQFFQLCIVAASLGFFSKFLISLLKIDNFVTGTYQNFVFTILPVTGLVITSTISNNIALSLGMVGALSIVRFRTPIKNPLELVIYFYLITLGIITNVNPSNAINFTIFFAIVLLTVEAYKAIGLKLNLNIEKIEFFSYYLRIELKTEQSDLKYANNLLHTSFNGNYYIYNLGFSDQKEAYALLENIKKDNILNYNIDKSS